MKPKMSNPLPPPPKMNREPGYYWVKILGRVRVAEYLVNDLDSFWYIGGYERPYFDTDCEWVNEHRILSPDEHEPANLIDQIKDAAQQIVPPKDNEMLKQHYESMFGNSNKSEKAAIWEAAEKATLDAIRSRVDHGEYDIEYKHENTGACFDIEELISGVYVENPYENE